MSLPNEFVKEIEAILCAETASFLETLENKKARPGLRVNTLKISVDDFQQISPFPLEPIGWCQDGFYYPIEARPAKHPFYHAGLYYLQEPSAMAPVTILDPKPGDKVLDLCSAPGGKSLQIAAKLQGQGLLVANDLYSDRLKALTRNIEQAGIQNAAILNETPERLERTFAEFFDKILIDAPCSGEGMFRKDKRAILGWQEFPPLYCQRRQRGILQEAAKLLKPGGVLVYSTCTFNQKENEDVLIDFLNNNHDFEGVPLKEEYGLVNGKTPYSLRLWPHQVEGEGHFIAKIKKKGSSAEKSVPRVGLEPNELVSEFFKDHIKLNLDRYVFEAYGSHFFLVSKDLPPLDGLRVSRPGWFIGELKKKRFEPSHALIMALKEENLPNKLQLTRGDKRLSIYLRGQTFVVPNDNGWIGVFLEQFPLGWGKVSNNVLKNHYPKGWRMI